MRKLTVWTLLLAMVSTCVPIFAATATDFYVELLRRGIAEVEAGREEAAVTPLRLAAFGLLESVEHYETAQVYLVVALDRLNRPDAARDAALRIIAAERVERKFASLRLPAPIRTAVMASARKLLPSSDVALLLTPSASQSTPPPQTSARPAGTPSRPVDEPPKVAESSSRPVDEPKKVAESSSRPVDAPPKVAESSSRQVDEPPKVAESSRQVDPPKKVAETPSRQVDEKPVATTPAQPGAPTQASSTPRPLDDAKTPTATTPTSTTRRPDDSTTSRPAPAPAKPTIDVPARLAAGERALIAANLAEARKIYRELLDSGGHDHPTWIRVAEGLYRSRDFRGALEAFRQLGTLRPGEEAYRYYVAVALYETGQYEPAKRELAEALPYIEITPDVERYRAKIDGVR